jgi:hypothetical protein
MGLHDKVPDAPGGDGIEGRAGDKSTALSYGAVMPRR